MLNHNNDFDEDIGSELTFKQYMVLGSIFAIATSVLSPIPLKEALITPLKIGYMSCLHKFYENDDLCVNTQDKATAPFRNVASQENPIFEKQTVDAWSLGFRGEMSETVYRIDPLKGEFCEQTILEKHALFISTHKSGEFECRTTHNEGDTLSIISAATQAGFEGTIRMTTADGNVSVQTIPPNQHHQISFNQSVPNP